MIKQVFKKPNLHIFIIVFLIYLILNIIISQFYITIQYIPFYLNTLRWGELLLSGFLAISIGILIAINATLIYIHWKQRITIRKQTFLASLGMFGGFATGICSACVAGLFPLIFGIFGIGFSFLSLPLKGMEIQALVIAILTINIYFLSKKKG